MVNHLLIDSASSPPPVLTQLTVNEYEPGQGIGSHIDTYECFGNDIFVVSIGTHLSQSYDTY